MQTLTGYIIRTQDYRETHKLVTILTKEVGKITAIARGANKPNSRMVAITQPFVYGHFLVYVSQGLSTLNQGEIIDANRNVREDIYKTTYASFLAELTWKTLADKEPHPYIYRQFKHTIKWINENDEAMIPLIMYELKLYEVAGISPIVNECVLCGENENLMVFSIAEGGVLCHKCQSKDEHVIKLSKTLIKLLQTFTEIGIERIGSISVKKENTERLRFLLDEYYNVYGGYPLKTKNVLKQLHLL